MAKKKSRSRPDYSYHAIFWTDRPDKLFTGLQKDLGSDGRALGFTQAWHRGNYAERTYCIWNEMICAAIGQFLRLPIPPFAMTHFRNREGKKQWLFTSLDFNYERDELPEVIPENCVKHLEFLSSGVLAFDILIANEDRWEKNLLVDDVIAPKSMHVFDHDQALFGGRLTVGPERFAKLSDRLGVTGSSTTGGNGQMFLPFISSCESLFEWCERIRDIPDWFIDDVCQSARTYGLRKAEAEQAASFLRDRKCRIKNLILSNRQAFSIGDWPRERELFQ
jgi:hypothetical protein